MTRSAAIIPAMKVPWLIPLLAAAAVASGCKQAKQNPAAPAPSPSATVREAILPVAEAPLDRAALLLAAARAGSAAATGADDAAEQQKLAGRRFELRIRFGCPPAEGSAGDTADGEGAAGSWRASFEEERRVLRVRVDPDINAGTPLLKTVADDAFEDAEGFWLRRPWAWTATCPPSAPPASPTATASAAPEPSPKARPKPSPSQAPAPLALPRIGIVQGFGTDEPRTHRVRQAYEVTRRLAADRQPSARGYDLVIAGRLRRFPAGKVIACRQDGPQLPPSCLISAEFNRIALVRGDDGEQIAEWTGA